MTSINNRDEMTKPKHPRPEGQQPKPREPVKPRILELMQERQSYTSLGIAQSLGFKRMTVWQTLNRMATAGEIWVVPVGHDNLYFKTRQCAQSFDAEKIKQFAADQLAMRKATISRMSSALQAKRNQVAKVKPGVAPGVTIKPPKPQIVQTVDMSGAKVTICKAPSFDARYQIDPATIVVGGFATMGIGRYSE